ncbi:unnamed protein product, partial [Symbiodinium pilosum]
AWLPLVSAGETAVVWTIQKMAELMPSTASLETKLEEAQRVADSFAEKMCEPKAISKVRQKRLASREQLRCLGHILSLLDLKLKKPVDALRPVSLNEHEQRMLEDGVPFLWNSVTGASEWDLCGPESVDGSLRVVLQPDEGSPMYCCYRFLASRGFKINLIRDEL